MEVHCHVTNYQKVACCHVVEIVSCADDFPSLVIGRMALPHEQVENSRDISNKDVSCTDRVEYSVFLRFHMRTRTEQLSPSSNRHGPIDVAETVA